MWDWLSKNSNLVVTLGTLIGGYVWHQIFKAKQDAKQTLLDQALSAITSVFDGYVASASTATSLDTIRVELRGLAAVQLGRFGIYEGSTLRALADTGVNAAIEAAIAAMVQRHPDPQALHAQVKATPALVRVA